jgi:hypothetical protein
MDVSSTTKVWWDREVVRRGMRGRRSVNAQEYMFGGRKVRVCGEGDGERIQDSPSSLASSLSFPLPCSSEEVDGMCKCIEISGQYFANVACRYDNGSVGRAVVGKCVDGSRTSVRERRVRGMVRVRVGSIFWFRVVGML